MADSAYDLFVIGAGSGGVRAARSAAQRGARVAVAESGALGGTCVNVGCIPKKLYSNAAHYGEGFEESHGYGWRFDAPPRFDWAVLKANRAVEITRLNSIYDRLLAAAGVRVLHGHAMVHGPHEVEVGGVTYRAEHLVVATGGHPLKPDCPGADLGVTSDDMFDLPEFPARLVVVGGGYIACEMASIFHGLGAQVTQVMRSGGVLRGFDADVSAFVAAEMARRGVRQRLHARVASIERAAGVLRVSLVDGEAIDADTVLYATGRGPNTRGLGLAEVGVEIGPRGGVLVDAHYQTSVPSIHAIGDVTDRVQLTPVALAEAMVLVDRLFGSGTRRMNYELIPTAVFTHPNVGSVGWTEAEARIAFGDAGIQVFRSDFKALRHTLSGSGERTLMKLVVDRATDRVVGLHMVGADAGEVVQGFAVALQAGATKATFDATLGIHPTVAEEFVTMREPVAM